MVNRCLDGDTSRGSMELRPTADERAFAETQHLGGP